jgi:hypothetical protein
MEDGPCTSGTGLLLSCDATYLHVF